MNNFNEINLNQLLRSCLICKNLQLSFLKLGTQLPPNIKLHLVSTGSKLPGFNYQLCRLLRSQIQTFHQQRNPIKQTQPTSLRMVNTCTSYGMGIKDFLALNDCFPTGILIFAKSIRRKQLPITHLSHPITQHNTHVTDCACGGVTRDCGCYYRTHLDLYIAPT